MNTKQFASSLRDRREFEAADRLEDLHQHFFETLNQRDSLRAEVAQLQKQLSQAIAERTPHDYGLLREEAAFLRKERDKAMREAAHWKSITEHRQSELNSLVARPEPSRLEIAAMAMQGMLAASSYDTLRLSKSAFECADALIADKLIAAAKDAK